MNEYSLAKAQILIIQFLFDKDTDNSAHPAISLIDLNHFIFRCRAKCPWMAQWL